ncbi:MAG: hypothetical protein ABEK17_02945, partial [Candidatus Aenigmatarchaeota archaeon]
GTLFPDMFKFLILAIFYKNFDFFYIINTAIWKHMAELTIWEFNLTTIFILSGILLLLHEVHILKRKKFWEYEELDLFLLFGIIIHLIIDLFWIASWLI